MSSYFETFLDTLAREFGNQVAKLGIGGLKALLYNETVMKEKVATLSNFPPNILRVNVIFHPISNIPLKSMWIECNELLTPVLALKIKEALTPNWYTGVLYVEGYRPTNDEWGHVKGTNNLFYIKDNKAYKEVILSWPELP